MQHPFDALAGEYASLLAGMTITRADDAKRVAGGILAGKYQFVPVYAKTGVALAWSLASFEREASSNFRLSPAQGDPWDRVSVNVPRGRGPFQNFEAAAIDAYHLDGLDAVGATNWTWARACYEGELFNGFGYRARGIHTPYLWAGTNVYDRGKYTADGQFDPNVRDQQLGIVPLMVMLLALDSSLALADVLPAAASSSTPVPQPVPVGLGGGDAAHDAAWIQASLNKFAGGNGTPLVVDGNYGRATRRAVVAFQQWASLAPDGIAGPATIAALEAALAAAA